MPDLKRVLAKAIRERDLSTIRRMLEKQSPQDIANLLDRLETQNQVMSSVFYRGIHRRLCSNI